jgi:hypothetical protein
LRHTWATEEDPISRKKERDSEKHKRLFYYSSKKGESRKLPKWGHKGRLLLSET